MMHAFCALLLVLNILVAIMCFYLVFAEQAYGMILFVAFNTYVVYRLWRAINA